MFPGVKGHRDEFLPAISRSTCGFFFLIGFLNLTSVTIIHRHGNMWQLWPLTPGLAISFNQECYLRIKSDHLSVLFSWATGKQGLIFPLPFSVWDRPKSMPAGFLGFSGSLAVCRLQNLAIPQCGPDVLYRWHLFLPAVTLGAVRSTGAKMQSVVGVHPLHQFVH